MYCIMCLVWTVLYVAVYVSLIWIIREDDFCVEDRRCI